MRFVCFLYMYSSRDIGSLPGPFLGRIDSIPRKTQATRAARFVRRPWGEGGNFSMTLRRVPAAPWSKDALHVHVHILQRAMAMAMPRSYLALACLWRTDAASSSAYAFHVLHPFMHALYRPRYMPSLSSCLSCLPFLVYVLHVSSSSCWSVRPSSARPRGTARRRRGRRARTRRRAVRGPP